MHGCTNIAIIFDWRKLKVLTFWRDYTSANIQHRLRALEFAPIQTLMQSSRQDGILLHHSLGLWTIYQKVLGFRPSYRIGIELLYFAVHVIGNLYALLHGWGTHLDEWQISTWHQHSQEDAIILCQKLCSTCTLANELDRWRHWRSCCFLLLSFLYFLRQVAWQSWIDQLF